MAQNQELIEEIIEEITDILQDLELQDNLQRFIGKKKVVKAIDRPYQRTIPNIISARFYNDLRSKLDIQHRVYRNPFRRIRRSLNMHVKTIYRSPLNLASILVANGDANPKTVENLFAIQYELKWHTETGDPDQFSFYGFCKDINDAGVKVMNPNTRKAHVISRLYHAQENLHEIRHLSHRELCPPVYVHTLVGRTGNKRWTWKKWLCIHDRNVFEVTDGETNINWITNEPLRDYITVNSMQNDRDEDFPNGNNHLYWAVLEEDDCEENQLHAVHGDNLSITQIYVGKAVNGIKDRWVKNTKSHCKNMELSRDVMYNMMNYDQDTLKGQQLVDLRCLLHKADTHHQEGDNSGLFIMNTFPDQTLKDSEKKYIKGFKVNKKLFWDPKDMRFGMNVQ